MGPVYVFQKRWFSKGMGLLVSLFLMVFVVISLLRVVGNRGIKSPGMSGDNSGSVKLVEGFPEVAVYPGAKLKDSSAENPGEGEDLHYTATWTTSESVPEVVAWYLPALEAAGWRIDIKPYDTKNTENQYVVALQNGSLLQLSVIRNAEASNTEITLAFPAKAEYQEEEEEE